MSLLDCTLGPGHRTGTARAYDAGCRCPDSREARRLYQAERYRLKAYGRLDTTRRVDATAARARLAELAAAGVNMRRMAGDLGYSHTTLDQLLHGRRDRALETTVEKILSYTPTPDSALAGRRVHSVGSVRRVRALTALGWTCSMIAAQGDVSAGGIQIVRAGKHEQIRAKTAGEITRIYDLLWDQTPPGRTMQERAGITRAKNMAAEEGWLPPMAWDDHGIDDLDYVPDLEALRPEAAASKLENLIDLLDSGVAPGEAAERAGYQLMDSATTALRRAGRSITEWPQVPVSPFEATAHGKAGRRNTRMYARV